jgi:hypothetical protein
MITTCSRLGNNWEQAVRTHLVDKLWDVYSQKAKARFRKWTNKNFVNVFFMISAIKLIINFSFF